MPPKEPDRNAASPQLPRLEEELEAPDASFVSVRISDFYSARQAPFDLHLRLGSHRYLRIFRAGEAFDEAELRLYESENGISHVWFGKAHRAAYMTWSLLLLRKISALPSVATRSKFGVARVLSELYLQELFEADDGRRSSLVDQGKGICEAVAAWVDSDPLLEPFLLRLDRVDAGAESLAFLTGMLVSVASRRYPWRSRRSMETLLLAAYFSDIGLFTLSPQLARLRPSRMSPQQKREYRKHPELSYLLLRDSGSPAASESVQAIVREHHEYCDGSGFPHGLTSSKILVLSKLLALCGDLARSCSELLLPPAEAVKVLFPDRSEQLFLAHPELVARYEKELLLPFFTLFPESDEEKEAA